MQTNWTLFEVKIETDKKSVYLQVWKNMKNESYI